MLLSDVVRRTRIPPLHLVLQHGITGAEDYFCVATFSFYGPSAYPPVDTLSSTYITTLPFSSLTSLIFRDKGGQCQIRLLAVSLEDREEPPADFKEATPVRIRVRTDI